MSATFDDYRPRHDGITIPTIALWLIASLLLHVALLLWAPPLTKPNTDEPVPPPLTAYLRSAPQPPEPVPPVPRVTPPPPQRAARAAPPPPAPPQTKAPATPPIALTKPQSASPVFTVPAPPEPAKPAPQAATPPPPEADFAALIAARRRARGEEPAPPDAESVNRGAMTNATAKSQPTITFGERPPTPSGGLFQIRRRGYDYAEFMFFGWNQNFGRAVPQLIEVRKEGNADIDIAVVRRIIALIRDHERGDFQWYSRRVGKNLTLSARARDNAGLEEFMLQEFYEDLHRYR